MAKSSKPISQRALINAIGKPTQMHEYALMIVKTLQGYPNSTSEQLQSLPGCWLNRMAVFSVDRILTDADKRGYVACENKGGNLVYRATKQGTKAYKKYNPS